MDLDTELLNQLDDQLKYFQAIIKYLDSSGNLDLIQAQAAKFNKEKQGLVYTFKLLIDPADIIEENAAVGNLLLCQPVQASRIFQEVIYKTIVVLQLLPWDVTLSQVAVILRFSSLPALPHMNIIESVASLSRVYDTGVLCKMVGMVTGTSAISKYTQSTRYFCPEEDCEGNNGNHFIRVHVPGASEAQTISNTDVISAYLIFNGEEKQIPKVLNCIHIKQRIVWKRNKLLIDCIGGGKRTKSKGGCGLIAQIYYTLPGLLQFTNKINLDVPPKLALIWKDFTCSFCQSRLVEEKSKRTLSDKVVAEIIPQKVLRDINSSLFIKSRGQVVPVYIRDDLTKVVEIGEVFEIIGTVRKDITEENITMMIEVNNIQKVVKKVTMKTLLQKIPRNVLKLYKDRRTSPWSFVLTLAYLFGADIFPAGSYFNLKLLLLLSLMSSNSKKVKPLHILTICEDTEPIVRLLQFGSKFKDYNSVLTANHGISGRVTVDKYKCAPYFIEGGVLHLAQNGVCYVGDVERLKKTAVDQLQHALSSCKIVTTVGSKFTETLPQQIEESLCSRVWGYVDTSACNRPSKQDDIFLACNTGNVPKSLLESFNIMCFVDSGDSSSNFEVQEKIVEQTIQSTLVKETPDIPITTEDFHKFLRFAERLDPDFTKEAETLLQSYFLACRKSRMSDTTTVPLNVHQTLVSLAYSHSKLALRSSVTLDDALMAIKLCEESLTARFGFSVLSVQPVPHVSSAIISSFLGPQNDNMMFKFHRNLLKYCSLASGLEE